MRRWSHPSVEGPYHPRPPETVQEQHEDEEWTWELQFDLRAPDLPNPTLGSGSLSTTCTRTTEASQGTTQRMILKTSLDD